MMRTLIEFWKEDKVQFGFFVLGLAFSVGAIVGLIMICIGGA